MEPERADPATGKPKWQVALALLYGRVIKAYRRRKIFKVERRMQFGQLDDLQAALQHLGFTGSINTAFVERINLRLRQSLAALTRRTWGIAQFTSELALHVEWWRAYYHFARYHEALRVDRAVSRHQKGRPAGSYYRSQTPAMAAAIVSRRWTVLELIRTPMH